MNPESILKTLLTIAWLLPLVGFLIEVFGGYWGTRTSKTAAYVAVFCIAMGFVCSTGALFVWGSHGGWDAITAHGSDDHGHGHDEHDKAHHGNDQDHDHKKDHATIDESKHALAMFRPDESEAAVAEESKTVYSGSFYTLGTFGGLTVSLDYYIDSLTLVMFVMVTFIATCIHLFAIGYNEGRAHRGTTKIISSTPHPAVTFIGPDASTDSSRFFRFSVSRCWD